MVRTVVYHEPSRPSARAAVDGAPPAPPAQDAPKDQFSDKLVKYIPAEVIAFFLPAYGLLEARRGGDGSLGDLQWLAYALVAAGVVGVLGYLFIRAPKDKPPRVYFYVLAALAFLAWVAGTSAAVSDVFHLREPEISGKLLVMGAVFLVPLIDEVLTRALPSRS